MAGQLISWLSMNTNGKPRQGRRNPVACVKPLTLLVRGFPGDKYLQTRYADCLVGLQLTTASDTPSSARLSHSGLLWSLTPKLFKFVRSNTDDWQLTCYRSSNDGMSNDLTNVHAHPMITS